MSNQNNELITKIDIMVSCKDLPLSNSQAILFTKPSKFERMKNPNIENKWKEHGRTEIIKENCDPKFTKFFRHEYRFEESQPLLFQVIDVVDKSVKLIGQIELKLAEIVGSKGGSVTKELKNGQNQTIGLINLRYEEVQDSKEKLTLQFSAKGLQKMSFFGKSDPFFVISRMNEDTTFTAVYTSEVFKNTLDCTWKSFNISTQQFCNCDPLRPIRIECWDFQKSGKHILKGTFQTKLESFKKGTKFELLDSKKKSAGFFTLERYDSITEHSFLDYIHGGLEISLIVGIDFTASNGDLDWDKSLHYLSSKMPNDYQKAIISVGDILNHYDSDKKYPVYGFGAKVPTQNGYTLSHCFPCTMDNEHTEVNGVQGILDVYNFAVNKVRFSGPTIFRNLIQKAAEFAKRDKDTNYYILLILTDGEICDMEDTIDEIVQASTLPLSIIIVGIGEETFEKMVILDADENPLVSRSGVRMSRDIVQFVPFKDFKNVEATRLAEEVLQEVPQQIVSYMNAYKIKPKDRLKKESFLDFKKELGFQNEGSNLTKDLKIDLNFNLEMEKKQSFNQNNTSQQFGNNQFSSQNQFNNNSSQSSQNQQFNNQFGSSQNTSFYTPSNNNSNLNDLNIGINMNLETKPSLSQFNPNQQNQTQQFGTSQNIQSLQNQNQFGSQYNSNQNQHFNQFGTQQQFK